MKLELSDRQAAILCDALDHYSRMGMGQLWTVAEVLGKLRPKECDDWDIREKWMDPMSKDLFQRPVSASDGICSQNTAEASKIAYDVLCVLRRVLAEKQDHSRISVWRDKPLHTCRTEPLAKVEP